MPEQLPLLFEFQANRNFNTFYQADNRETINHLKKIFTNSEQQIYLWGETGSGKTHLLQATSQQSSKYKKTSFYLPLDADQLPCPSILDGLEDFDLVCLDNIDQIFENNKWEQAFFNFYNLHRDNNKQLIISASCPPKYLPFHLADLKSRMNWGLTLKLQSLDDEQLLEALVHKAHYLGFDIPHNVGRYLLAHYARDLPSVWISLDKIEHATLAEKRKITIPFLKQIMNKP